jgi:hypothetical protein
MPGIINRIRKRWPRLVMVAAVLVGGTLAVNYYLSTRRAVYVVNGLPVPVQLAVEDGPEVTVLSGGHEKIRLSEGPHRAALTVPKRMEEQVEFTVPGGFFERMFGGRTKVLNVFGAAVISRETTLYSSRSNADDESTQQLHLGKDFLVFDGVDYEFEEFPQTITTKQKSDFHRTRVAAVPAEPLVLLYSPAAGGLPVADLMRYVESHLRARPENTDLLWAYAMFALASAQGERGRAFTGGGLDARPIRVEWHRCHQELCERTGGSAALKARYERMLRAEPESSALLYLTARLQDTASGALAYIEKALAADPENAHAWMAKAFHLRGGGQFAAARDAAARAAALAPKNAQMAELLVDARLAAGDYDALERQARESLAANPADVKWRHVQMELRAARGDLAGARQACEALIAAAKAQWPEGAAAVEASARQWLRYIEGDLEPLAAADDPATAFRARLELGRIEQAELLADELGEQTGWTALAMSVSAHAGGRSEKAAAWQAKATEKLSLGSGEDRAAAALLDRGADADVEAARELVSAPWAKAMVLVALAQAGADGGLVDAAAKLNYRLSFPHWHWLLARAIAKLRGEGR